MVQTRFTTYKAPVESYPLGERHVGIFKPGRYTGFDMMTTTDNKNLTIGHTGVISKTKPSGTAESNYGALVMPTGIIIHEAGDIKVTLPNTNNPSTGKRLYLLVCEHNYQQVQGGVEASYFIIAASQANGRRPELSNPSSQVVIGVITRDYSNGSLTYKKEPAPLLGDRLGNGGEIYFSSSDGPIILTPEMNGVTILKAGKVPDGNINLHILIPKGILPENFQCEVVQVTSGNREKPHYIKPLDEENPGVFVAKDINKYGGVKGFPRFSVATFQPVFIKRLNTFTPTNAEDEDEIYMVWGPGLDEYTYVEPDPDPVPGVITVTPSPIDIYDAINIRATIESTTPWTLEVGGDFWVDDADTIEPITEGPAGITEILVWKQGPDYSEPALGKLTITPTVGNALEVPITYTPGDEPDPDPEPQPDPDPYLGVSPNSLHWQVGGPLIKSLNIDSNVPWEIMATSHRITFWDAAMNNEITGGVAGLTRVNVRLDEHVEMGGSIMVTAQGVPTRYIDFTSSMNF